MVSFKSENKLCWVLKKEKISKCLRACEATVVLYRNLNPEAILWISSQGRIKQKQVPIFGEEMKDKGDSEQTGSL
jgi:hypothetical protein